MTKVKIKNFQSIHEAEFEIEGFTVIVGKNNIGKSAIIRSIDAALTNRTGNEFIREGQKQVEINLEHDKLKIEWKKGTKTSYKVNDESFSALNRGIPKPLTEAGFRKIELSNIKLVPLLADQFSPIFLLNETGSNVTEALSHIYKLDLPSRADDLCQKELKSTKNMLKIRKQDLEKIDAQIEVYKDFDTIKKEVGQLEELDHKSKKIQQNIEEIKNYKEELSSLSKELKTLKPLLNINIPDISNVKEKLEEINKVNEWAEELKDLIISIKSWEDIQPYLENVQKLEEKSHSLNKSIEDLNNLKKYHNEFRETALSAKEARDKLPLIQTNLDKLEKQKTEIKACPLCQRPF